MPCVYLQRIKHLYVIKRRVQSAKAELVNERLPVLEPYLESASEQASNRSATCPRDITVYRKQCRINQQTYSFIDRLKR